MMRVYAISDLHGNLPYIPDCELLILGGDYCPTRNIDAEMRFVDGPFRDWLKQVPAKYIVGIAGNHDFIFQEDTTRAKKLPWIYLEDSGIDLEGVKIWGTPYTVRFGAWAFMKSDTELAHHFGKIPKGLDILISHGPAYSILDKTEEGIRAGSRTLYGEIKRANPDSVICGDIHEARGIEQIGDTRFYNVSYVNRQLEPKYNPVSITLRAE